MLRFFQSLTKKKKQKTPEELKQEVDEFEQKIYKNYIRNPKKYKNKLNEFQRDFTNDVSTIEKQAEAVSGYMALEKGFNMFAQRHGYKNARNYLIKDEEKRIAEEKAKAKLEEERRKQREEADRIEEERQKEQTRKNRIVKNKKLNNFTVRYGYPSRNALLENALLQRSHWRTQNPSENYLPIENFIDSNLFLSPAKRKAQEEALQRKIEARRQEEARRKEEARRQEEEEATTITNTERMSLNSRNQTNNESELSMGYEASPRVVSHQELIRIIPDCKHLNYKVQEGEYYSRYRLQKQQQCLAQMQQMGLVRGSYGGTRKRRGTRRH